MPKPAADDNKRINARLRPEPKATLLPAAALSERDSIEVLTLLENPPAPNERLQAAIAAMPKPA